MSHKRRGVNVGILETAGFSAGLEEARDSERITANLWHGAEFGGRLVGGAGAGWAPQRPVVYLLTEVKDRFVKVGYSKTPTVRLAAMRNEGWQHRWCIERRGESCAAGYRPELMVSRVWWSDAISARLLEGHCHRALRRMYPGDCHGEWYAISAKEATAVIEYALTVAVGCAVAPALSESSVRPLRDRAERTQ